MKKREGFFTREDLDKLGMKKLSLIGLLILVFLAIIFLMTRPTPTPQVAAAGTLNFAINPNASTVSTGKTISATVNVANAADLYGVDISVAFNSSVLNYTGFSESTFLNSSGSEPTYVPDTYTLYANNISHIVVTRLGNISGATGNGTIITLRFKALASGTSNLNLSVIASNSNNASIPNTVTNNSVIVSTYTVKTFYSIYNFSQSQDTSSEGMTFSSNGRNMYLTGTNHTQIYEYSLSTPWDLSTVSYTGKYLNVSSCEEYPEGIDISSNGSYFYLTGYYNTTICQFTMNTPYDISTAVKTSSKKILSSPQNFNSLRIGASGTKVYIFANGNSPLVMEYNLSTPWAISSATSIVNYTLTGRSSVVGGYLNSAGTEMYILEGTGGNLYQYALSTPWDVSSASYDNTYWNVGGFDTHMSDLYFNGTGTLFYLNGRSNDKVYELSNSSNPSFGGGNNGVNTGSGGSSGGGGGGSATTSTGSTNGTSSIIPPSDKITIHIPRINASEAYTNNDATILSSSKTHIKRIEILTLKKVLIVTLTLQDLGKVRPGSDTPISTENKIFSYLEIGHDNLSDENISSVQIEIQVDKSWISNNEINASNITVYRFSNGWQTLKTIPSGQDNNYYFYNITSPGLSILAITGNALVPTSPAGNKGSFGYIILIILGVLVLVMIILFVARRAMKQRNRENMSQNLLSKNY